MFVFLPRFLIYPFDINWATLLTLLSPLSCLFCWFCLEKSWDLFTAWWLKLGVIRALPFITYIYGDDSFMKPPCGSIYRLESKLLCTSLLREDLRGICWPAWPGMGDGSLLPFEGDRGSLWMIWFLFLLDSWWAKSTLLVFCIGYPYLLSFSWLFWVSRLDFLSSLRFVLRIWGILCVLTLPLILWLVGRIGF